MKWMKWGIGWLESCYTTNKTARLGHRNKHITSKAIDEHQERLSAGAKQEEKEKSDQGTSMSSRTIRYPERDPCNPQFPIWDHLHKSRTLGNGKSIHFTVVSTWMTVEEK